jgi:hypothetical protein
VVKLDYADPPALSFEYAPVGSTSSDSPQTVEAINIGSQPLIITGLSYPVDFPEAAGDANPCTGSTVLSPGLSCDLPVQFTPQNQGVLKENLTLTDNNLNGANVKQSISLSGTTLAPQTITFATPPDQNYGTLYTLSATASSGLTVSFASNTTAVCTVSGTTVTFVSAAADCFIEATQAGNSVYSAAPTITRGFYVYREAQSITFAAPPNKTYGAAPFTLSATASSDLAVSFASTTLPVCTVSGTSVTLVSGGTCTIKATQAGNGIFGAAPVITQSFTINKTTQAITFTALPTLTYGETGVTLSATASSGQPVKFTSTTPSICTVSGTKVTVVGGESMCTIQASQAGDNDYLAAPVASRSSYVNRKGQAISFATIPTTALSAGSLSLKATSTSGLAVSFASTTSSVCTVSGTTATLVAAGICTIEATQAGNTDYIAAGIVTRSFNVGLTQTITFTALPTLTYGETGVTLSATASSGLTVSFASTTPSICTVSGMTLTVVGGQSSCTIQASQAGNNNYLAAPVASQSSYVNRKGQAISFATIPATALSAGSLSLSATASSGLVVSFASTTSSVCTVSGTTATLVSAGTCTIEATQAGNSDYLAAGTVLHSFTVTGD